MLPSVDDVFYIFIDIDLKCRLYKHNPINPAFQRYISCELVLPVKKGSDLNSVLMEWECHSKNRQNCSCNGWIITAKSNLAFHFSWKYVVDQAFGIFPYQGDCGFGFLISKKFLPPVQLASDSGNSISDVPNLPKDAFYKRSDFPPQCPWKPYDPG